MSFRFGKFGGLGVFFLAMFLFGSFFSLAGARKKAIDSAGSGTYLLAQNVGEPERPQQRGVERKTPFRYPTPEPYRLKISADEGEKIFRNKCVVCHTIGKGLRVGPDLESVTTRRPHDYLLDFISDPKRVVNEGNVIATALLQELGVLMPDLGLSRQQILDILEYIKVKSGVPVSPVAFPVSADAAASEATAEAQGEVLFQLDCSMCHTVGHGPMVGPDLKGITKRRSHEWLLDFISNPEQMFAKHDPQAMKALEKFKVKMPNIYLNRAQIEYVLAYIKSES
jgi:cytochrome c2